ncbi:unnamed protein product [Brachionus calyciflorus]|uniref:Uncharacterized protein n=1 Tax=Brachionus calyciflorus TaxID=104777 RepID=A0A813YUW5_9BILA|nr:unnamed protein product [Brachionus calyciflorus]
METYDLKCVQCNKIFQSTPITLAPCGWVICSHHFGDFSEITCILCQDRHHVKKSDCVVIKTIENKYAKYKLQQSISELELDLEKFKSIKQDPINHVNEFINQIKNKVCLQKDNIQLLVDFHFDKIHQKLKSTQTECQESLSEKSKFNNLDFNGLKDKVDLIELMFEHKITKPENLKKDSKSIEEFKKEIKEAIEDLTDGKLYTITPMDQDMDFRNLFGKLKIINDMN